MQNFDYLKDISDLRDLYQYCQAAEAECRTRFDLTAINSRRALEWIVKIIYQLKRREIPERASLYELMTGAPFVEFINDDRLMMAAHYIRKVGNAGAHDGVVTKKEAFFCTLNLYNLIGGILLKLGVLKTLAPFDDTILPDSVPMHVVPAAKVKPILTGTIQEAIPAERLQQPIRVTVGDDYTEAQTRRLFIDVMLREAGWQVLDREGAIVPGKACIEIPVSGMPNEQGIGYADYVLFGSAGKPLAVVEAKRTTRDPAAGKHQAELYADCLMQMYGIRPIIYYSNGFQTKVVDGLGYPERTVFGFHTEDELQLLIQRRGRSGITDLRISNDITDRDYQKMAIHSVCDCFNKMRRRALLVMATGTGKTRVSVSLSDVLMRNGWVKNILFLADRTALVSQAKKSFVKLLPNSSVTVLSEEKKPDLNARIVFSTYQTMINYIDADDKLFSIGRFDLIIIDEAHRSVFGKYVAILDYFDALMVGLTATPREDIDKSTFDLFDREGGDPNFEYGLTQAIDEDHLVNFAVLDRSSDIMKAGVKYDERTAEEQKQLDEVWKYESTLEYLDPDAQVPTGKRDVKSGEIFSYIYNNDTVDAVLRDLMEVGLTIEGGEKIGKSVIFAANHKHAVQIVERFKKLYPEYGDDFCAVIDDKVDYAQDLIVHFGNSAQMPQIAVSVDMLDTGIDVPEIVNLVFFKKVRSKIKFWQMVGRGTRKCADLFGEGLDKQYFCLFDWGGNVEYFRLGKDDKPQMPMQSLTERIFNLRLDLACLLQNGIYQSDPFAKGLHDELKQILRSQLMELRDESISVRRHWELVDRFRKESSWAYVSGIDAIELKEKVAPILIKHMTDNAAKRFDVLILNIQLSLVDEEIKAEKSKVKVCQIAQALQEKASIAQVASKLQLINEVADPVNMKNPTLEKLEYIRSEMRDLVQFIYSDKGKTFTLNIKDIIEYKDAQPGIELKPSYRQRIMDWLNENRSLPVLQKLKNLEQLTHADIIQLETICWRDLGTKDEYQAYVRGCKMICGDVVAAFIRSIIGIDQEKAIQRYSDFLTDTALNPDQEEYLKSIILYVCKNGDISTNDIVNTAPFNDPGLLDVFGDKAVCIGNFVRNLHQVIVA